MDEKMFYDREHWQAFTDCLSKMKQSDVYRIILVSKSLWMRLRTNEVRTYHCKLI